MRSKDSSISFHCVSTRPPHCPKRELASYIACAEWHVQGSRVEYPNTFGLQAGIESLKVWYTSLGHCNVSHGPNDMRLYHFVVRICHGYVYDSLSLKPPPTSPTTHTWSLTCYLKPLRQSRTWDTCIKANSQWACCIVHTANVSGSKVNIMCVMNITYVIFPC